MYVYMHMNVHMWLCTYGFQFLHNTVKLNEVYRLLLHTQINLVTKF